MLQKLRDSSLFLRRRAFHGLQQLLCGLAYSYTREGSNPFWKSVGYPGPPVCDNERLERAAETLAPLREALLRREDLSDTTECDVVIVGSGAGGSVAAAVLAEAGYQVIVVDKGHYVSPEQVENLEAEASKMCYEQSSLLTTKDGAVMILAGATVGGGTAINWSCCLPLPEEVQREWAAGGLRDFEQDGDYENSLAYILKFMGADDRSTVKHNKMNQKLQEGCDALEYDWETTGQNLQNTGDPAAGYIGFGDRYGNKKGGLHFLLSAVQHGAKIVEQCQVQRVLITTIGRATGVTCQLTATGRCVTFTARKCVVIAAGALHTPCLLQRSGLRNQHIGKHLRLHPVTGIVGLYDDPIDCWSGAPLTTACNEFENNYGAKIECPSAHPGLLAAAMQWISPEHFKCRMARYRYMVPLILVQRDSGEGSVHSGRDGESLVVKYKVSKDDKKSLLRSAVGAIKILLASGASEATTGHIQDVGYVPDKDSPSLTTHTQQEESESLKHYLHSIAGRGIQEHKIGLFSAHQMGSCRMSCSPASGAVDENGETWEVEDLYVMDTSVFPTASGANPMVAAMTLSHMWATRLSLLLRSRDGLLAAKQEVARAEDLVNRREAMRAQAKKSAAGNFPSWSAVMLVSVVSAVLLRQLASGRGE
jgi:choline dehydrogenase-like flavoprotein